jgi:ElaB/YqjD/DUF883 family membrane-anchored ribosome-binding protein
MAEETIEGPGGTQATHSASHPSRDTINGLEGAGARLQARAQRAVEVSTHYLSGHDVDEMRNDLEREIRAHPIKSIAIALGAGYVLGRLFR